MFDLMHRTYDLSDPSPLVMTNFELVAFVAAVVAVAFLIVRDIFANHSKK